jgi:hypothetical protein
MILWLLTFLALLGWAPWRDAAPSHQLSWSAPSAEAQFTMSEGPARVAIGLPQHNTSRSLGYGSVLELQTLFYLHPKQPAWVGMPLPLGDLGREERRAQERTPQGDSHAPTATDRAVYRRIRVARGERGAASDAPCRRYQRHPAALSSQLQVLHAAWPRVRAREYRRSARLLLIG